MNTAPFEKITREEYNETVAALINTASTQKRDQHCVTTTVRFEDHSCAKITHDDITLYTTDYKIIGTLYTDDNLAYTWR